jgi:hypothetical protein
MMVCEKSEKRHAFVVAFSIDDEELAICLFL